MVMIRIERLFWSNENIEHIAHHEVVPSEVEEVMQEDYAMRDTYGGRYLVTGPTKTGRMLSIVLHPRAEGVFYVVTARVATRKERTAYHQEKGGVAV